jgi:pimeloyl-ACP methyl ester carboxylesterase
VKIIWGRQDPFLSSTLQLDQFKKLLEVQDEHVLLLESAKHLIAEEQPESIVRFIR